MRSRQCEFDLTVIEIPVAVLPIMTGQAVIAKSLAVRVGIIGIE